MFKLNEKSIKFYTDLGTSQGKSILDVLQELGALNVDDNVTKQGEVMNEYMNCCNNPYYFIDKIRMSKNNELEPLDVNITGFMSIKTITEPTRGKANKILSCFPRGTEVDTYILGYVLHQLLFKDKYVFIGGKNAEYKVEFLEMMYNSLPKFLQSSKTYDNIKKQIITEKDDLSDETGARIGLIVYFQTANIHPSKVKYNWDIPTIICNEGGDIRNFEYQFNKERNSYGFKIVKFAPKDMGISNETLKELFDRLSGDFELFLKEIYMEYDPMSEEEFNLLEDGE